MNYGCLDIKGYVASVNQAEPFEIYCLRGILHLIGRKKGRNFRELTLFQPCFHLCQGEVRSSAAMRLLLRIFIILFSFWTNSSSAGKFSLTFLSVSSQFWFGKLNLTENVTSKQAISRISNHLFANLRTMITQHFSH